MTKNYKAVLKSSLVMLVLFAVAGSDVAQAQQCIARAKTVEMVRAEGITEVVGDIEVRCRRPDAGVDFGFEADIPEDIQLTVTLNTNITNEISDERVVKLEDEARTYSSGGIELEGDQLGTDGALTEIPIDSEMFTAGDMDGELTEDGDSLEWEFPSAGVHFDTGEEGFNLIIRGIRANASLVGDGEDIMANVMVGDTVVNSAPIKVADVTEGLAVKADVADGLQCADTDDAMAVITIQEGFTDAIISMVPEGGLSPSDDQIAAARANSDSLVVTFTGIPDGVMVMVPSMVPLGMIDDPEDEEAPFDQIPDPAAFSLMLREGTRTDGVGDIDEDTMMGAVELNTAGAGEVIYNLGDTDGEVNEEWVKLPVTFAWESGGEMPVAMGAGYVDVSFHPVSSLGGVSFDDSKMPRFVESNDPDKVVEIDDCITTLLFPFVTNKAEFDTGMVISNTSSETGSCTIEYSGADAPADRVSAPVEAGEQWIGLVSVIAKGFQGYITATCGFRDAFGFAFLANGYGVGAPTAAQSYLAVCTDCD